MTKQYGFIGSRTAPWLFIALLITLRPGAAARQDPVAGTDTVSEQQLVDWVLERNPSLAELRAAAAEAAARVQPAGSLDDPMLSYALPPATVDGFRLPDGTTRGVNTRIELMQAIPWPGTLALREEEASRAAEAAAQSLADQRLHIVSLVRAGFAEWYYVHRALEINDAHQALLIELRRVAETQYAAGRAAQQDVLQAEVEHASLQDQALALERERRSIQAQLNALINRRPDEGLPPPAGPSTPQAPPGSGQLQTLALARHPELMRLEAELQASAARIGLAEKKFYPDFKLMAGYNSLWGPTDQRWIIGASINLPIDRSKYNALLDAAKAGSMKARWRLVDQRNLLLAALERSRAEVVESLDVIELYRQRLVPLADENLRAAEADYRAGAGDFLNVITAEGNKLMTELRLERARANYIRRHAELERWVGGPIE